MAISGIGKHSREETIGIGLEDLRAISKYLGSKHYFTGFKPTRVCFIKIELTIFISG